MAYKTPPMRGPVFDAEVEMPNGAKLPAVFRKITTEWAEWFTTMARAMGFHDQTLYATAALNFPLVAAGATQDLTITVTGVFASDVSPIVTLGLPTGLNAGLLFHAWVSADDTVTVRCTNATAAGINPASATFRVEVRRY